MLGITVNFIISDQSAPYCASRRFPVWSSS